MANWSNDKVEAIVAGGTVAVAFLCITVIVVVGLLKGRWKDHRW